MASVEEDDSDVWRAVNEIHKNEGHCVLWATGGATEAIYWLQASPGASHTLLEAAVPYSRAALAELLELPAGPAALLHGCASRTTAVKMAGRALARAAELRRRENAAAGRSQAAVATAAAVFGVACSAALATTATEAGAQLPKPPSVAWIAAWSRSGVAVYRVSLAHGLRSRRCEENAISRAVVAAVAAAKGVPKELSCAVPVPSARSIAGGDTSDAIAAEFVPFAPHAARVAAAAGNAPPMPAFFVVEANGCVPEPSAWRANGRAASVVVFTGSFNPLHQGHKALLQAVEAWRPELGAPVAELSLFNVDKPQMSIDDALARAAQFAGRWAVAVSAGAALFVEKARLFGDGTTFVVGLDTATRVFDKKYYGGSSSAARAVLAELHRRRCSFLVAGRVVGKAFKTFASERRSLPFPEFHAMFSDIPGFRLDVSSSEIRRGYRA